jgi:spore coat protein A, manganese oxidase
MAFTRKEFLKLGLVGGAGLALSSGASASSAWGNAKGTTRKLLRSKARLPKPFMIPLFVPPVLEPVRTDDGIDYYEMAQKVGRAQILPGLKTEVWATMASSPAPPYTLVAEAK